MSVSNTVDHPRHYNAHPSGVECITVAEHFGFNLGNVIKYIWRSEEKGAPIEDLRKAAWYLAREIARREAPSAYGSAADRALRENCPRPVATGTGEPQRPCCEQGGRMVNGHAGTTTPLNTQGAAMEDRP